MKLYNIFESLILEGTKDKIIQAINDKVSVRITYRDANDNLTKRYIFIYGIGTTKAGNPAIRAFQAFGGTKTENSVWKIFLIDRITEIELTDFKFYKSVDQLKSNNSEEIPRGGRIPKYVGPSDKSMMGGSLSNHVTFDNKNI
jgi:predicted DNA-binding transcriptional regulator YafY